MKTLHMKTLMTAFLAALALALTTPSRATLFTEFFDYGDPLPRPSESFVRLADHSVWSGATVGYYAGERLTFNDQDSFYDNSTNPTGSGSAGQIGAANAAFKTSMALSGFTDAGDNNPIWISALATANDSLLWFNGSNHYIRLDNTVARLRISGSDTNISTTLLDNGDVGLMIAKLQLNHDGANDRIDFWVKAEGEDISSESALGSPLSSHSTSDFLASSLGSIQISFSPGARMDAIHVSNDMDAFAQVVAIPEPGTLALVLLAGVGILASGFRRRR